MKNILRFCGAAIAALFLCPFAQADSGHIIVDGMMPVPPVVAYSSTFSVRTDGINWGSAEVTVTSVTQVNQTFNDGMAATGSFTVANYTSLSTAPAHSTLTISSDTALANSCISGGGSGLGNFNVCNYAITGTTATDCAVIAAAITAQFSALSSTCPAVPGNVINSTFTFGAASENSFTWNASTPTAISTGPWVGGHDNAVLSVNGFTLTANNQFFPITSNAVTASAIATAWQASAGSLTVTMGTTGNVVGATATVVGPQGDYALFTSTQGALTIAPFTSSDPVTATGFMAGGTASSYTINGSVIQLAKTQNLGQAQPVWLSQTVGSSGLTPLSVNTTYYVIPGLSGSGQIQLALTSTGAIAGLPIVLTSSAVKTTADVFQLNVPQGIGQIAYDWVVSNDNVNWSWYKLTPFNVSVASLTIPAANFTAAGVTTGYDLGHMDYGYLGIGVAASSGAPVNIQAHVIGKGD